MFVVLRFARVDCEKRIPSASEMFEEASVYEFAAIMNRSTSMMARCFSNSILNMFSQRCDSLLLRRCINVQT